MNLRGSLLSRLVIKTKELRNVKRNKELHSEKLRRHVKLMRNEKMKNPSETSKPKLARRIKFKKRGLFVGN